MTNKYQFLQGDYVIEFESPLPLNSTMKWFSKNCFDKNHISYEFASQPMPKNCREEDFDFQTFPSLNDLSNSVPNDLTVEAVALFDAPLSKINCFVNVIKSRYKIKRRYFIY